MKGMFHCPGSFCRWTLSLFNSPPRDDMTMLQKASAILTLTSFIIVVSIVSAVGLTAILLVVQWIERISGGLR
ncbi:hypothetical protein DB346_23275 [Verrucomicrobia bacterium LW23]|nr:hypothetical protein DB346_23275 [Verrucomicrobia bacterium LW23]